MQRLILVKTAQAHQDRRDALDATWVGGLRNCGTPVYYVEGGHDHLVVSDSRIALPQRDDRHALTQKVRDAFTVIETMSPSAHVFACDDDTFVHPARWLDRRPQGDLECRLYWPRTQKEIAHNGNRPWAHGGGGYWVSPILRQHYIADVHEVRQGDDVLVARVAQQRKVTILDAPSLYSGDSYSGEAHHRVAPDNTFITCHHVGPEEMLELWRINGALA